MTRKAAIKALFNQNRTEALWGAELAKANRLLARKREAARARRK